MFTLHFLSYPDTLSIKLSDLEKIASEISILVPKLQSGSINISFIDDTEMQRLNREYREIDKTTDVLSFHYFDDFSSLTLDEVAGEILLSESRIMLQAAEHGHSREKETLILIIHGILHILGYDHESDQDYEEMWKYEERLRAVLTIE